jgi:succinate dehydrogenase/fumarate reductase-like Fe-S protein
MLGSKPRLAASFRSCATHPGPALLGDLSVNTGKWMRGMSERVQGRLHLKDKDRKLSRIEERMDPDLADKICELDRRIECGCCVAACGTARMREDFVGAVGLNRVARFHLDPRAARTDADFYEVIDDDDGFSAACRCLAVTTAARRSCRSGPRSASCAARW